MRISARDRSICRKKSCIRAVIGFPSRGSVTGEVQRTICSLRCSVWPMCWCISHRLSDVRSAGYSCRPQVKAMHRSSRRSIFMTVIQAASGSASVCTRCTMNCCGGGGSSRMRLLKRLPGLRRSDRRGRYHRQRTGPEACEGSNGGAAG